MGTDSGEQILAVRCSMYHEAGYLPLVRCGKQHLTVSLWPSEAMPVDDRFNNFCLWLLDCITVYIVYCLKAKLKTRRVT